MSRAFAFFAVILFGCSSLVAQPLAQRVPADAVFYAGWRGTDALGPQYDLSHLKAVMDASQAQQFIEQVVPQLLAKFGEQDPKAGQIAQMLLATAGAMWRYPSAIYIGGLDMDGPVPQPRIAVLCQAGDEASQVKQQLADLASQCADWPVDVSVLDGADGLAVLTIGTLRDSDLRLLGEPGDVAQAMTLKQSPAFISATARVRNDAAFMFFVNGEQLLKIVDEQAAQVQQFADPDAPTWQQMKEALGLDGFKSAICAAGFAGSDWSSQVFIEAPSPRRGLLTFLDGRPVSPELLQAVPQSATMLGAAQLDLAAIVQTIFAAAAEIDPNLKAQLDQMMFMASAMTGVDIQNQLLPSLGDEWAYYTDRQTAGAGMMGLVVVSRPRDAQMLEASLTRLTTAIDNFIGQQMGDDAITLRVRKQQVGSLTLYRLGVPFIAPTWTMHEGYMVMGLYPQTVVAACDRMTEGGESILDNPEFVELRRRLHGENATSLSYTDIPQSLADGYPMLLMMSQMYLGMMEMMGFELPPLVIPPLHAIQAHVSPSGSFAFSDEAGWHRDTATPFPGADLAGDQTTLLMSQQSMMVGILLPALGEARSTARQMQTLSQLRGIHQCMVIYAAANDNTYPPDLATLLEEDYLDIDYLIAPTSHVAAPPDIMQWPREQRAAWINENTSFHIIAFGQKETMDSQQIVGFTKPGQSNGRGISVVFDDSHAAIYPLPQALDLIDNRTGKTIGEILNETP